MLFAGGRLAGGGNVVEEGKKLDTNVRLPVGSVYRTAALHRLSYQHRSTQVLAAEPSREGILPYVKVFQVLLRSASIGLPLHFG